MYNNVTGFLSTPTKNLSFIPTVHPASDEHFGKIIDGKIRIRIYDFSKGKGNAAVEVAARVDLENLPYLKRLSDLAYSAGHDLRYPDTKFPEIKIFGDPMSSGQYQGLCQMTKLEIVWNESKKAWGISIQNGYGKKIKTKTGGFTPATGSWVQEKSAFFSLSAGKFSACIQNTVDYLQLKKFQVGITEGNLARWEDAAKAERESYKGRYPQAQSQAQPQSQPQPQAQPQQVATPEAKNYRVTLVSGFEKDEFGVYCMAEQKGRQFQLYFKKYPKSPFPFNKEIVLPIVVIDQRFYWAY